MKEHTAAVTCSVSNHAGHDAPNIWGFFTLHCLRQSVEDRWWNRGASGKCRGWVRRQWAQLLKWCWVGEQNVKGEWWWMDSGVNDGRGLRGSSWTSSYEGSGNSCSVKKKNRRLRKDGQNLKLAVWWAVSWMSHSVNVVDGWQVRGGEKKDPTADWAWQV